MTEAATGGSPAAAGKGPLNTVQVQWQGDQRFDSGRRDGPIARLDGSAETGQSPVDALLSALGACAAIDVVEILAKRRTPVATLDIEIRGQRVSGTPRRLEHVHLAFRITGEGIERVHAERAIDLAINKYCSVKGSLDPDLPVEWSLSLNEPAVRTTG